MRFVKLWLHGHVDLPGGVKEQFISIDRGFEIWREDQTGGFWIKKGSQVCRWIGPTAVSAAEPVADDAPDAPSKEAAKRGPGRPPKAPEPPAA